MPPDPPNDCGSTAHGTPCQPGIEDDAEFLQLLTTRALGITVHTGAHLDLFVSRSVLAAGEYVLVDLPLQFGLGVLYCLLCRKARVSRCDWLLCTQSS
jgi:hypothetical protein